MIVNHKKGSRSIVKVKIGGNEYYSYLMEDKYIKKGSKKRVYGRTEEELKWKVREIKEQFDLLNPTKPIFTGPHLHTMHPGTQLLQSKKKECR